MLIYVVPSPGPGAAAFHGTLKSAHDVMKKNPHPHQEVMLTEITADKDSVIAMLNGGPYQNWKTLRRWVLTPRGGLRETDIDAAAVPGRRWTKAEVQEAARTPVSAPPGLPPPEPHRIVTSPESARTVATNFPTYFDADPDAEIDALVDKACPIKPLSPTEQEALDDWRRRHPPPGYRKAAAS